VLAHCSVRIDGFPPKVRRHDDTREAGAEVRGVRVSLQERGRTNRVFLFWAPDDEIGVESGGDCALSA
jgi:hypothetical protein